MKISNRITRFVSMTMVVTVMTVLVTITAEAQNHIKAFEGISFAAVIPGQMLRFSVFMNAPAGGSQPVRAQVLLYDAEGDVIARSQAAELSPGKFRSFDFNWDELSLVGEPGTGRAQVRGVVQVAFLDGSVKYVPEQFPAWVETVDTETGRTVIMSSVGVRIGAVDR
jgi:hypothetical protein